MKTILTNETFLVARDGLGNLWYKIFDLDTNEIYINSLRFHRTINISQIFKKLKYQYKINVMSTQTSNEFKIRFDGQLHQVDANTLISSLIKVN